MLYVQNTESPWLRELATGNMYVLLSGRWYRCQESPMGPGRSSADELPASFADIPPASDIGGLRTSVAGTPEAEEAVLRCRRFPQTAAIKRSEAISLDRRVRRQAQVRKDQRAPRCPMRSTPAPRCWKSTAGTTPWTTASGSTSGSATGPWAGGRLGAGRRDREDSAQFAGLQHHARARLRVDAGGGLRGLYAGLHVVLPLLRRAGLRHRLALPALLRPLVLPAPADLGFQCRLQPLDRLEFRHQLEQRLFQHGRELGRRLRRRLLPRALLWRLLRRRLPRTGGDQYRRHQYRQQRQHRQSQPRSTTASATTPRSATPGEFAAERVQPAGES